MRLLRRHRQARRPVARFIEPRQAPRKQALVEPMQQKVRTVPATAQ